VTPIRALSRAAWLDIALATVIGLSLLTDRTVLLFHVVFIVLALEAFVRDLRAFVIRMVAGVGAAVAVVLYAVVQGRTQPDELTEIPLLTTLIIIVFAIAAERKRTEDRLSYFALHDSLTGLANRLALRDRLRFAIARLAASGERFAVLLIDLDDFKDVNDSAGHDVGDAVLAATARRLTDSVRTSDLVARLGGDEFAGLLEDDDTESRPEEIAARIVADLAVPFVIDDHRFHLSASVGLVRGTPDDPAEVMRRADIAMYSAKAAGKGRYRTPERLAGATR
jgi:diguanylate cyclase (GGDEF)-like protein